LKDKEDFNSRQQRMDNLEGREESLAHRKVRGKGDWLQMVVYEVLSARN
jgi:hypothetical protein